MPGAARLKERVLKLPLRVAFASILIPLLLAGICSCTGASAKPVAAATPAHAAARTPSATATLLAFARQIGVTCDNGQEPLKCIGGRPEVGDYYDIELHPGCGDDGWFAAVIASQGADLRDRIAPTDRTTLARLYKGELLCVQAIGRSGEHASYYYARQAACVAVAACNGFDNSSATSARPPASCSNPSDARPNACAAGWVRAEAVGQIGSRR